MKIAFVTFADNKFYRSLNRIESEARGFSCFTDYYIFHQTDIDKDYLRLIKPNIYRRGYGYWRWKPYFAKKVINQLAYGDVLVWADAGCCLKPIAEEALLRIIENAKKTKSGMAAFLQTTQVEKQWTKGDLFEYLNATEDEKNSPQFLGGMWIAVKTDISTKLIEKWYQISSERGDLIMDVKSKVPNADIFVEHRHDQSTFSLLIKRTDAFSVKYDADYLANAPIIAAWKKENTICEKIRHRLIWPWRYMLGLYLKYVKGFYFFNRIAW